MDRDPYARADERYLEYLEEKEKRVRRPRREHEAETLLKSTLAHEEVKTKGALEEREMIEAAHGRRLGREQEFARPLRTAEIGERRARTGLRGAEAEDIRYGTEFKKGARGTIESILASKAEEAGISAETAGLGLTEERHEISRRDEAEAEAIRVEAARKAETDKPPVPARPGRKMRPAIERFLWSGRPEIGAPGLLAPIKGWHDISKLLKESLGESYEYAFPRGK